MYVCMRCAYVTRDITCDIPPYVIRDITRYVRPAIRALGWVTLAPVSVVLLTQAFFFSILELEAQRLPVDICVMDDFVPAAPVFPNAEVHEDRSGGLSFVT